MKKFSKIIFSIVALFIMLTSFSQDVSYEKTMSRDEANNYFSYWSFPLTAADTLAGSQDSILFEVNINKHTLVDYSWYVDMDTIGNGDSINLDIVSAYKIFDDTAYTTISTTAWDGDANGDLATGIYQISSFLSDSLATNDKSRARKVSLYIKPTTGAGLGDVGDKVKINKVVFKLYVR